MMYRLFLATVVATLNLVIGSVQAHGDTKPRPADEEELRVQPQILAPQRRLDAKTLQAQILKNPGRPEMSEESTAAPSAPAD